MLTLKAASLSTKNENDEYLPSTVVVFTELVKLILSVILVYFVDGKGHFNTFLDVLVTGFIDNGLDVLKLCLPAVLYGIQNNLQYVIETSPLFLVLYQSKIITTAVFYTFMLSKYITTKEWVTIIILAIGVSLVESSQHEISHHHFSNMIGMLAVTIACLTSGFAGVYFEKVLKSSNSSIWILNMQLSMMSFSFCSVSVSPLFFYSIDFSSHILSYRL
jgi:UDP-sugar transporter A1/2/3